MADHPQFAAALAENFADVIENTLVLGIDVEGAVGELDGGDLESTFRSNRFS